MVAFRRPSPRCLRLTRPGAIGADLIIRSDGTVGTADEWVIDYPSFFDRTSFGGGAHISFCPLFNLVLGIEK